MRYKTLVRVAVKVLGVYLAITGLGQMIGATLSLFGAFSGGLPTSATWYYVSAFGPPIGNVGLGLYCFLGGTWVVNRIIPSNRPYCPECGYELTGLVRNRCPECGTPLSEDLLASSRSAGGADGAC